MSLKTDMAGQEFITNQGSCIKVIEYINDKNTKITDRVYTFYGYVWKYSTKED